MIVQTSHSHILNTPIRAAVIGCLILFAFLGQTGCAALVSRAATGMMEDLSRTILNSNDLEMVKDGAPAYLLMIDSLAGNRPDDPDLSVKAAMLYTAYSDMFVQDVNRSARLSQKALDYAVRGLCRTDRNACGIRTMPFEQFQQLVSEMTPARLPVYFALGNAWASWIKSHSDDFNAIADISRIEVIMTRISQMEEGYQDGAAYLYLGTLASLLPPALGGRPEQAKAFFEKAVRLSGDKNLMVKVMYARTYARMMFDRDLHDRLLKEVLTADPAVEGYTLVNTLAQKQAGELLDSGNDYF